MIMLHSTAAKAVVVVSESGRAAVVVVIIIIVPKATRAFGTFARAVWCCFCGVDFANAVVHKATRRPLLFSAPPPFALLMEKERRRVQPTFCVDDDIVVVVVNGWWWWWRETKRMVMMMMMMMMMDGKAREGESCVVRCVIPKNHPLLIFRMHIIIFLEIFGYLFFVVYTIFVIIVHR